MTSSIDDHHPDRSHWIYEGFEIFEWKNGSKFSEKIPAYYYSLMEVALIFLVYYSSIDPRLSPGQVESVPFHPTENNGQNLLAFCRYKLIVFRLKYSHSKWLIRARVITGHSLSYFSPLPEPGSELTLRAIHLPNQTPFESESALVVVWESTHHLRHDPFTTTTDQSLLDFWLRWKVKKLVYCHNKTD